MVSASEKAPTQDTLSMKTLLEAGVHFGHQTQRWHPRMKRYILAQRNGIHIIDLQQSMTLVEKARGFVADSVASGSSVLFVGTKRQAQDAVEQAATSCDMFYVKNRWLGGMLTNITTIQSRINHLEKLEEQQSKGMFELLSKKEALKLEEQIQRLNKNFGGVKDMKNLPGVLVVVDIGKEKIAVAEARRLKIPIVALVDTDGDPDLIDYPIAANDDAIRSINLITSIMADGVREGVARRSEATLPDTESDLTLPMADEPIVDESIADDAPSAELSFPVEMGTVDAVDHSDKPDEEVI